MLTEWVKGADVKRMVDAVEEDAQQHGWNATEALLLVKNGLHGMADAEMQYLFAFVVENQDNFDSETIRDQLLALWTAYCFHHDIDVDTSAYDEALMDLWKVIVENPDNHWHDGLHDDFVIFSDFMCQHLV